MLSILRAARRIRDHVRRTPLVSSPWLSEQAGADVRLKLECHQETHAFKLRGAMNAVLALSEFGDRSGDGSHSRPRQVVTASAGNHGQALALAARAAGLPCTVFTPRTAPRAKLDAIARHGATLDTSSATYDDTEPAARAHAASTGALFISPYNDPDVIAGNGTVGLEIVEDWPDVDTVIVPVGGGGLAAGVGIVFKSFMPGSRTIGVEAACNPAFAVARARGAITEIPVTTSIADGLTGNLEAGSITFPLVERYIDELTTADEPAIASAIRDLVGRHHVVAEGAGAVGVAAVASGALDLRDRRVAIIVSGGNIDLEMLAGILAQGS